jgi:hypothetical protein
MGFLSAHAPPPAAYFSTVTVTSRRSQASYAPTMAFQGCDLDLDVVPIVAREVPERSRRRHRIARVSRVP